MLLDDKFVYFLGQAPNPPEWFRNLYIEKTKPLPPSKPKIDEKDFIAKREFELFVEGFIDTLLESSNVCCDGIVEYKEKFVEYKKKTAVYYNSLDWKVQILWSWLYAKTMTDVSIDENMISINSEMVFNNFVERLERIIK